MFISYRTDNYQWEIGDIEFKMKWPHHERKCPVDHFATHISDITLLFSSRCWVREQDCERDKRCPKSHFTWLSALSKCLENCTCSLYDDECFARLPTGRCVTDVMWCWCLCSLFIAPGLCREEASVRAPLCGPLPPETVCTPVHSDTVATIRPGQEI